MIRRRMFAEGRAGQRGKGPNCVAQMLLEIFLSADNLSRKGCGIEKRKLGMRAGMTRDNVFPIDCAQFVPGERVPSVRIFAGLHPDTVAFCK